jgi:hypothetical protein
MATRPGGVTTACTDANHRALRDRAAYRALQFTPSGSQASIIFEVFHDAGGGLGGFHAGTDGRAPGPGFARPPRGTYASFTDPDGDAWLLREITERFPGVRAAGPGVRPGTQRARRMQC